MRVSLTALRAFEAVARTGGIARAAEELSVGPTTISRHVAALERRIGTALLRREGRGIALTPAGIDYHAAIRGAFGSIETATDRLSAQARGEPLSLMVMCDSAMLVRFIAPRLAALRRAVPGIGFRLAADEPSTADAPRSRIVFCRIGAMPDGVLLSKPPIVAVTAPGGPPLPKAAALDGQTLLHHRTAAAWQEWLRLTGNGPAPAGPGIIMPDKASLLAAAEVGSGIALACTTLAGTALLEGRLRQVLGPGVVMGGWYAERPQSALATRFVEWLRAEITAIETQAAHAIAA